MSGSQKVDLTVIITAHSEGILLHKTLLSILRSVGEIRGRQVEFILHVDSPTRDTTAYLDSNVDFLKPFRIFYNEFRDAGLSRNFAVGKASGNYLTFIDGDDLVSRDWFKKGLEHLIQHPDEEMVVHAESTLEFGAFQALVKRHDGMNRNIDGLLSVYANRWNAVIMTSRSLLLSEPYIPTSQGYGYEDWHLMNRLIARGVKNVLIPKTAIFIRRKLVDSRWAEHKNSASVLQANPLLSFENIRSIDVSSIYSKHTRVLNLPTRGRIYSHAKRLANKYPLIAHMAKPALTSLLALRRQALHGSANELPSWLVNEWRSMQSIENQLFPTNERLATTQIYDSITSLHWQTGLAYKAMIDHLHYDAYAYIIFVPWLVSGGADDYAINYANTIQAANPEKHVLVITTLDHESPWISRLGKGVDYLEFGKFTADLSNPLRQRLLEQLVENSHAECLHIINSALAYEFIQTHESYMRNSGKRLVLTSFSQSVDSHGRVFGYSHTHVPSIYHLADYVTSDNQAVIDMWVSNYGFDRRKLLLHRQPVTVQKAPKNPTNPHNKHLRVLWAARLSPEKIPSLVPSIGNLVSQRQITIDMYGRIDADFDASFMRNLPKNVSYKGEYDGFSSLPLERYDAFLYTSLFDGMPNVLLEAGVAGLAVVSSSVGGIGELIHNEKTGLLIEDVHDALAYANALSRLMNPEFRLKLTSGLHRELMSSFSPEKYRRNIIEMLKNLDYF